MDSIFTYQIPKLRGMENWVEFESQMTALFTINNCRKMVAGKDPKPLPPLPSADNEVDPVKLEQYEQKLELWEKTNAMAMGLLALHMESGPRKHVEELDNVYEQWERLKEMYRVSDLVTFDNALAAMSRTKLSSYKGIDEYTEALNKQQAILKSIGHPLEPWLFASMFRIGLDKSLEP